MGSYGHDAFNPLDLEVIDRVYEAAWARLLAMKLPRDETEELERQKNLRKRLFALARPGGVEFDTPFATWFWPATPQGSRRWHRTCVGNCVGGFPPQPHVRFGSKTDLMATDARVR